MCWQKYEYGGVLKVKIKANAKQSKFIALKEDRLHISIASPALGGKANLELIKFLSKKFKIPQSNFTIKNGSNNPLKTLIVRFDNCQNILNLIAQFISH